MHLVQSRFRGMKRVHVATHGHCFDGLCSAVVFSRLHEFLRGEDWTYDIDPRGYGPGENGVPEADLNGDENAILDYRYTASTRLHWYFDHHVSAFATPEDRANFDAGVIQGRPLFHDGTYGSATQFIVDTAARKYGLAMPELDELVHWSDVIDRAAFADPAEAVARETPALQLMTVVEHQGDAALYAELVPALRTQSIEQVLARPGIAARVAPLLAAHRAGVSALREVAHDAGGVVFADLSQSAVESAPKFVTYADFPRSAYSVVLTRSPKKLKISVGYNPWSGVPRTHNIAAYCERHGGGGHPVVGAISLPADAVERARQICAELVEMLRT